MRRPSFKRSASYTVNRKQYAKNTWTRPDLKSRSESQLRALKSPLRTRSPSATPTSPTPRVEGRTAIANCSSLLSGHGDIALSLCKLAGSSSTSRDREGFQISAAIQSQFKSKKPTGGVVTKQAEKEPPKPTKKKNESFFGTNSPVKILKRSSSRAKSVVCRKVVDRKVSLEKQKAVTPLANKDVNVVVRIVDTRESRPRTRTRRQRSVKDKLTKGIFSCTGARSVSRTPERNQNLRVRVDKPITVNLKPGTYSKPADDVENVMWRGQFGSLRRKKKPSQSESSEASESSATSCSSRNSSNSLEPPELPPTTYRKKNAPVVPIAVQRKPHALPLGLTVNPQACHPPKESKIQLVKTLKLDKCMKSSKWISGIEVTRKNEIIAVDLTGAYLLDEDGVLKKTIGAKGHNKLVEPIDVTVMSNGNLVFSDHFDQAIKIFNWKGQFLRQIEATDLTNIAGVAVNQRREIFVAGTDKQCVSVYSDDDTTSYTVPKKGLCDVTPFEHPYSIAISPLTGNIIVGDDYKQVVVAISSSSHSILWRFSPSLPGSRHFFPSSICVDNVGYVFIADLYNEKIYMLDSSGKCIKTLLSRGGPDGLKGGPSAIATDGRGHLLVADEERTIKVFKYGENGFALYRRFSYCPQAS